MPGCLAVVQGSLMSGCGAGFPHVWLWCRVPSCLAEVQGSLMPGCGAGLPVVQRVMICCVPFNMS